MSACVSRDVRAVVNLINPGFGNINYFRFYENPFGNVHVFLRQGSVVMSISCAMKKINNDDK